MIDIIKVISGFVFAIIKHGYFLFKNYIIFLFLGFFITMTVILAQDYNDKDALCEKLKKENKDLLAREQFNTNRCIVLLEKDEKLLNETYYKLQLCKNLLDSNKVK